MSVEFDISYWTKKYEDDYLTDQGGNFPVFFDDEGVVHKEKSPYFETMSEVLQKRGYLLKREFVSIGKWKTMRQSSRYEQNISEEVQKLTREAINAPEEEKIRILRELKGVGLPVASAILTVIYPKKYCVIDYRTWRAFLWLKTLAEHVQFIFASYREYSDFLDLIRKGSNVSVYRAFLKTLRGIGAKRGMTARQVEMALWKFDQLKGEKPKE